MATRVHKAVFVDQTGTEAASSPLLEPLKVSRAEIEREIERLASLPTPKTGRRRSVIVHPELGSGAFLPAIEIALEVLLPGERTPPYAELASAVGLCIRGEGRAVVGPKALDFSLWDIWSIPNMSVRSHVNTGSELQARLMFSDVPLLRYLRSHYVETVPAVDGRAPREHIRDERADVVTELSTGAMARTYEGLIDPPVLDQQALLWRWTEMREYLNSLNKDLADSRAADIALLWNPSSGRANGTTNTLTAYFAGGRTERTEGSPNYRMARSHRHMVAAINYPLMGSYQTIVERKKVTWEAGDLIITGPAWAVHSNGTRDDEAYTVGIQDLGLHMSMNTALWQEYLSQPPALLGAEVGFLKDEEAPVVVEEEH
jgi:gentisate 1,2-dioxygenase